MQTPGPVTPYLVASDAAAALAFYAAAFGAVETMRSLWPNTNKIMHARFEINGGLLMISDDFAEITNLPSETPLALHGSPVTLALQVQDANAIWAQAIAAGATVLMPLSDMFWGDRYGQLKDPFGHKWSISQTLTTLTAEEAEAAATSMLTK